MTEQQYQKKISDDLEKQGYFVINLIKTNRNGIPDLLAVRKCECNTNPVVFIECKTPKGVTSIIQKYMLSLLQNYSASVSVSYGNVIKKWKNS